MRTSRSGDRRPRLLAVTLLVLALATPALAAEPASIEAQARALAARLRCPVCQNLSVADSSSDLAQDMRALIRTQLEAGRSPEEIEAYFVSKYGDWILLSPRPRGLSWLLWIAPFAGGAGGVLLALRMARGWRRRTTRPAPQPFDPQLIERVRREARVEGPDPSMPRQESPLDEERRRLYAALRELEFDHRSGKLSDADYAATREQYETRAAGVLAELARSEPPAPPPTRASAPAPTRRVRRPWRLASAGVALLVFGVVIGYSLSQAVRARTSEQQSITGDPLTGTGRAVRPSDLAGSLAAGRAAYEREDWRPAIEAFKQALALEPDNPDANTYLALILLHSGHAEDAMPAVERALARAPTYRLALWAKGIALFEARRDYAGAIRTWEKLLTLDLAAEEADRVAAAITEARQRLAERTSGPRPSPAPRRAGSRS